MRVWFVALAIAFSSLMPLATSAQQIAVHEVAPADEYFGKLQMSILGIRNELATLSSKVDADAGKDEIGGAEMVEDAFRDWAQKYPHDTWLDRYAVQLEKVYARVETGEGRMRLAGFAQWIHERFAGQQLDTDCSGIANQTFALPSDDATDAAAPATPEPSPSTAP